MSNPEQATRTSALALMEDRALLAAVRACKPGAPQLRALATEVTVRALTHHDAAVFGVMLARCTSLTALREAYRRERDGERRPARARAIAERGRVVAAEDRVLAERRDAALAERRRRDTSAWLASIGIATVDDERARATKSAEVPHFSNALRSGGRGGRVSPAAGGHPDTARGGRP